jgi:lipopolysaccharide export system protein LptA
MNKHRVTTPRWFGAALGAVALVFAITAPVPAHAQGLTNNFGGLGENSREPIDIESDVLVVHDSKKYATFKGNVKAVQGKTTLLARELDVHYTGSGADSLNKGTDATATASNDATATDAKTGDTLGANGNQISKIEARGSVIITTDQDQTTTSDWALYDVPTQMVTVGGNVVLTQGKNVLKGDRLIIDLKTGESRFENQGDTATKGRIRALFVPRQDAKSGESKSDGQAGDGASGGKNASRGKNASGGKSASSGKPAAAVAPAQDGAPMPLMPPPQQ